MRDRLVELIAEGRELCEQIQCEGCTRGCKGLNDCIAKVQADHLLKNGVIVPPCKVGDTVYWLNFYNHIMLYRDKYYEAEVVRIVVTRFGVSCVIRVRGEHSTYEIPYVEFGKNVFLTREEAEQALKGEHNAEIH
jgi:hypothetical protein